MNRPIKRETASKHARRHRVLASGRELFLLKGYWGTTVDEICQRAGVTKGTFFYHFDSKESMARQLLERYIEELTAPMAFARDPHGASDPMRRIEFMLGSFVRSHMSRRPVGCLIGIFVSELAPTHHEFRRLCERAYGKMECALRRELLAAGFFHSETVSEIDPVVEAESLLAVLQGAVLIARAKQDATVVERTVNQRLQLLKERFVGRKVEQNTKLESGV